MMFIWMLIMVRNTYGNIGDLNFQGCGSSGGSSSGSVKSQQIHTAKIILGKMREYFVPAECVHMIPKLYIGSEWNDGLTTILANIKDSLHDKFAQAERGMYTWCAEASQYRWYNTLNKKLPTRWRGTLEGFDKKQERGVTNKYSFVLNPEHAKRVREILCIKAWLEHKKELALHYLHKYACCDPRTSPQKHAKITLDAIEKAVPSTWKELGDVIKRFGVDIAPKGNALDAYQFIREQWDNFENLEFEENMLFSDARKLQSRLVRSEKNPGQNRSKGGNFL